MTVCNICGVDKDESCYSKYSQVRCIQCRKEIIRNRGEKYYRANKEKIALYNHSVKEHKRIKAAERRLANKNNVEYREKEARRHKNYRLANLEKVKAKANAYYAAHKEKWKAKQPLKSKWSRMKYKTDPEFRMRDHVRKMMRRALRIGHTEEILGCSWDEFKTYMESKFLPGMTWDNNTMHGWHIDHIKPLSCFDVFDPDQVAIANHYTNLQPLWASDNKSKSNRYEG